MWFKAAAAMSWVSRIHEQYWLKNVEIALKSGVKLMLQKKLHQGKILTLDVLNKANDGTKYNCFGSEYE